ncbi:hypothetical protein HZB03_00590 [Candidatus Woesearchaeota archaeon]|nr:hypothetical protein [Candidatus Woesearchaeota archaeon]
MVLEQTLFLIKPRGMEHESVVMERLKSIGDIITYQVYDFAPMDCIQSHYEQLRQTSPEVYSWFIEGYCGKSMSSGVLQGEDIIERMLLITGDTDPEQAGADTIRHMAYVLNGESLAKSIQEKRMCDNFIHRSKKDAFKFERGIWHPDASFVAKV